MIALVVVLLLVGTAVVVPAATRAAAQRRWQAAGTARLEVGPLGVRRELLDGRVEEVHWDEIVEVDVVVASTGPHGASGGVVVLYADGERGCLVPIDRLASSGVLEQLSRLPGFRVERLTAALDAAPPSHTTCWSARG